MFQEALFHGHSLFCNVIPMGKDYALAVYGGERPHIGSVVMAVARPSLTGEGISATSSVLNGIGHKDETVARAFAEAVAIRKECTAVCACGIHFDNITREQIEIVQETAQRLLKQVLQNLEA